MKSFKPLPYEKPRFVDANGFIHEPNQFFVFDGDGRLVTGSTPPIPALPPPPRKPKQKKPTEATFKQLEKLEDAIYSHGEPYRKEFLTLIKKEFQNASTNVDNVNSCRHEVLRIFWNARILRPSKNGLRVIDYSKNPYGKK